MFRTLDSPEHMGERCVASQGTLKVPTDQSQELEYARKLLGREEFLLVTGSPPLDCRSIAKASNVRILHLPPRASVSSGCDRVKPADYGRS